jgi:hypothetical protein
VFVAQHFDPLPFISPFVGWIAAHAGRFGHATFIGWPMSTVCGQPAGHACAPAPLGAVVTRVISVPIHFKT